MLSVCWVSLPGESREPVWHRPVKVRGDWGLEKGGNGAVLFWASNNNFINRCEECPLLEDEDDISDEEMELMVR